MRRRIADRWKSDVTYSPTELSPTGAHVIRRSLQGALVPEQAVSAHPVASLMVAAARAQHRRLVALPLRAVPLLEIRCILRLQA
jgi:hypothetical protein